MHGLAAQELADTGSQHGATVTHAGKRREARALELHLVPERFPQKNRTSITELACPDAELVSAINTGQRLGSDYRHIAREGVKQRVRIKPARR